MARARQLEVALRDLVDLFEAWKKGPLNGIIKALEGAVVAAKWVEDPPAIQRARELLNTPEIEEPFDHIPEERTGELLEP